MASWKGRSSWAEDIGDSRLTVCCIVWVSDFGEWGRALHLGLSLGFRDSGFTCLGGLKV